MDGPSFSNASNASVGSRIAGYLIDLVIIVVVSFIPVAGWIAAPAYMLTRDALPFLDGQSIGKKLVGIRAVDRNGAALTNNWEPALIRNVVLFIPLFPFRGAPCAADQQGHSTVGRSVGTHTGRQRELNAC